jgi:integrase
MPKLTETKIKAAKPRGKAYKLRDERGLYLLVTPTGGRLWRLRFGIPGRVYIDKKGKPRPYESMVSLGAWPDVDLEHARERCDAVRKDISKGVDPSAKRRAEKLAHAHTFEAVGREFLMNRCEGTLADVTYDRAVSTLEQFVFPYVGSRPIDKLEPPDVLDVLRRIEAKGDNGPARMAETARRVSQRISQVMRYGVATGRCKRDVTVDLRGALKARKTKHHASITEPARIGELLRANDGYTGHGVTLYALKLAPLLFVRPGELRHAEWAEFDLDSAEPQWLIPAPKMKMREAHIVPLSIQAVALLRELRMLTGPSHTRKAKYLFPALTTPNRPMSENTENTALRRLGYTKEEMTAHGFRSLASTRLNEGFNGQRFNREWIERQLAHAERDQSTAAYNYAEYLPERRKMMQSWADYLDGLRAGANVIPFKRTA